VVSSASAHARRSAPSMTGPSIKPLILIVEDFDDAREMYRDYLEFSGFRAETARDGREAIDKARTLQPDLILMDLSLPGIDGWEATRLLKAEPDTSHLLIVALSAHALAAEGSAAPIVGAVDDASAKQLLVWPDRPYRGAIESCRHDQIASTVALTACLDVPAAIAGGAIRRGPTRSFETFAEARFDPELRRVGLDVSDDLRSRRIDSDLARKGESRQSRSRLRRVEAQTVVMPAPACADEGLRLDQNEGDVSLCETGRRRQTGRSGADDQHITAFHER